MNSSKRIAYQSNPAVIKSALSRLPRKQLVLQARYIRKVAFVLPVGNERRMYVRLYLYCMHLLEDGY